MRFVRNDSTRSLAFLFATVCAVVPVGGGEVLNVYQHRHYEVDKQVNDLFTKKTGIEVRVVNAEADQLIERLKSEGANSPADVLITVDAGRMHKAKADGLLQTVSSETLESSTPLNLRV